MMICRGRHAVTTLLGQMRLPVDAAATVASIRSFLPLSKPFVTRPYSCTKQQQQHKIMVLCCFLYRSRICKPTPVFLLPKYFSVQLLFLCKMIRSIEGYSVSIRLMQHCVLIDKIDLYFYVYIVVRFLLQIHG